jgi:predicted nucleotidyltransferase
MADIALTEAERTFLESLDQLGVRYMIVGLGAAVLQGADTVTADVDLWFEDRADPRIHEAAKRAGGVWIPGHFGAMPPMLGGDELGDRFDVVLTMSGLDDFASEYARTRTIVVDGLPVRVLPLERIIHSKRTAARPKDRAVLPALEAALTVERDREDE